MIGTRINFKPDYASSQYYPTPQHQHHHETPKDFNFSMAKTVKNDTNLFSSPNHGKVNEMFQSMGPANPYSTKWFRKVLKNQFDVELKPVDSVANSTNVKWKVKKVKNARKPSRPSHDFEDDDYGSVHNNRDFLNSQQSNKNAESLFFGSQRMSMNVVSQPGSTRNQQPGSTRNQQQQQHQQQPAMNNFVHKVKKFY